MSHPQTLFPQTSFHAPSLLQTRRATVSSRTAGAQLRKLRETGRYRAFSLEPQPAYADRGRWPCPPAVYWDSDVAKWLEGACYLLADAYDAELDAAVRDIAAMIRGAQQADGYINTWFTIAEPERRWSNIRDQHELYNAGHLIEAALAHSNYYKNNLLIEPIEKYVKYISTVIGPGPDQKHAYPGHPEIELALLRLYTATGNKEAYGLAQYFIEERGNQKGQDGQPYYDWEREQRGDSPWKHPDSYQMHDSHWYNQAHAPILEQKSIEGHAVRAMYLLTGVADLLCLDKLGVKSFDRRDEYHKALTRLWNNMVDKKMYLTGGIGSMWQWEGFGIDYFLPQGSDEGGCYNETCASIGVIMLAERLLHLELNSKYADVMELCLYNAVMTGLSLQGTEFTYVNQLASSDADRNRREDWFDTSCCPPNVMRLFGSLGGYLWDYGGEGKDAYVNVHLYTTAKVTFRVDDGQIVLEQKSNWPWKGNVMFLLQAPTSASVTLRLRIPSWARGRFTLTPSCKAAELEKGYLVLPPDFTAENRAFSIQIGGFQPRFLSPHPYTNQQTLTLARGPLVYCVEDVDNDWEQDHFRNVGIEADAEVEESDEVVHQIGERYVALRAACWIRQLPEGRPESSAAAEPGAQPGSSQQQLPDAAQEEGEGEGVERRRGVLTFVPYYLRANRGGEGHMRVGLLRR